MSQPTLLTLFSGGGLADCGYRAAGFLPVGAVEYDPDIAEWYVRNHGDHCLIADVGTVDYRRWEGVDLLHMSPVCTRASVANQDAGESDLDLRMADACCRALREARPRWVVLENVGPYQRFESFRRLLACLRELGYATEYAVLNAADYGVPQTRRRLILRACREGRVPSLPQTHCEGGESGGLFGDEAALLPWVGWYAAVEDLVPTLPESRFADWQLRRLDLLLRSMVTGYNYVEVSTHGRDEATTAGEVLRLLREAIGAEGLQQWSAGVLEGFQQAQVLRSGVHGAGLRSRGESANAGCFTLSLAEAGSGRLMPALRSAGCGRRASSGREPDEQFARELGAYLQELSHEGSPAERRLRDLWRHSPLQGVLQQALSSLQEIRRSQLRQDQHACGAKETDRNPGCARCTRQAEALGREFCEAFGQSATSAPSSTGLLASSAVLVSNAKTEFSDGLRGGDKPAFATTQQHNGRLRALLVHGTSTLDVRDGSAPSGAVVATVHAKAAVPKALLVDGCSAGDRPPSVRESGEPAYTLTHGGDSGGGRKHRALLEQGRVVAMTPRALGRFQTLPDAYVLPEKASLACKIVGNGVPSLLCQQIGQAFLRRG